eukprot:TRINITY_DN23879_c0_g1_i1.p1 TRINITY_DN23879_c0_g1~~TRINITY_DN23879_c0_g1_i1.p1  ORF type:complete len:1156 (+),score=201.51 TRINITY_DN23879_c0_g1_i1:37-3504(+)
MVAICCCCRQKILPLEHPSPRGGSTTSSSLPPAFPPQAERGFTVDSSGKQRLPSKGGSSAMSRRCISFSRNISPVVVPESVNLQDGGKPNRISTTRFTFITWLPKSLLAQFMRAANIYFLFVCIIAVLPNAPVMPSSVVVPFCGVLLWTALKDMYEDRRRQRDDDAENLGRCLRYEINSQTFVEARWMDVKTGDLLLSFADEAFPADVLLVRAHSGQAFISTVNLDGETNLKDRRAADLFTALTEMEEAGTEVARGADSKAAVLAMASKTVQMLMEQGLKVDLDEPRSVLTDMDGSVSLEHSSPRAEEQLQRLEVKQPCKLNFDLFVPRGCVLRNTLYVLSVAAYCGRESKTRLNTACAEGKVSNMQVYVNRGVQGLVMSLVTFCLYCATSAEAQGVRDDRNWFTRFLFYWIILYQIVPISLYVCFEIVKLVLGILINQDPQMFDPRSGKYALARTADLVEEMGQVNFVFSDKTGTLTENEMVFAHACVGNKELGDFRCSATLKAGEEPPGIKQAKQILANDKDPLFSEVLWFFLSLATNHTVQVEVGDKGENKFEGSSADEVAFVDAAASVGVTFAARNRISGSSSWDMVIKGPGAESRTFTVLCEVPFSSDRKRMSILTRHEGEYWVMCKGADNIMGPLCDRPLNGAMSESLSSYSKLGLRTLVIARKKISNEFATEWIERWKVANQASEDREQAVAAAASEIEHSLLPAGITAIEDKLQEGVPEAITTIKAAGIRFWVLTGDKTETAVEIVKACRLFTEDMALAYLVNCRDEAHAHQLLEEARKTLAGPRIAGLVIDGSFAQQILASETGRPLLYELAISTKSCVCCRLSPQQKRRLVELVKEQNLRGITLAIGDGANDVSMIQGAHVGIGIRGKEGNQAVQASDIAISQFRFLVPLLLCHGRRAYRRVATFVCYMLYKHTTLVIGEMIWAHQITFAANIAYPEWLGSAFPAVIAGLPIIVVLCLDRDIPDEVAIANPELYIEGMERMRFNSYILLSWIGSAVYHGTVAWLLPNLLVGSSNTKDEAEAQKFWCASVCSFMLVVIFINFRLWMTTVSPFSTATVGVIMFSFFCLILTVFILSETSLGISFQPEIEGSFAKIFTSKDHLMVLFLTPLILLVDLAVYQVIAIVQPYPLTAASRKRLWTSSQGGQS